VEGAIVGQGKRHNRLWQFGIFFILSCSLLLTAFFPIPFSDFLSAQAQPLTASNFSSPVVVDSSCLLFNATSVIEYRPGTKNNGIPIEPPHDNPENALGSPEGNGTQYYVSLGLHDPGEDTGTIILGIDPLPEGYTVVQLEVVDEPHGVGDCTDHPENITVSVAEDMGGWQWLGTGCQTQTFAVDPPMTFRYVRIQDISDRTLFPEGEDGYDLNGIVVTACRLNPTPTVILTPTFAPTDTPTLAPPMPTDTLTATPSPAPTDTRITTSSPAPVYTLTETPPSHTNTPTKTATVTFSSSATPTPTTSYTPVMASVTPTQPAVTSAVTTITHTPAASQTITPTIPSSSTSTPAGLTLSNTPLTVSQTPTNTSMPITPTERPMETATATPPAWVDKLIQYTEQVAIEILGHFIVVILCIEAGAISYQVAMLLLNHPHNPESINHFIDFLVSTRILTPSAIKDILDRLGDYEMVTRDLLDGAIRDRENLLVNGDVSPTAYNEIQEQISIYQARLDIINHLKRQIR
jgi:hypothetical protein